MRIGTLFSGIGSPEQAASRVWPEHKIAFACEWDKYARQSYLANYNIDEAHFHTDVREMDGKKYQGKCDILVAGSPCQSFSIAGLRNGTDDERGQLIYQYIRIVEEAKTPIIVYENVKGMMSIDGGRTIKEFIKALREIGYYCHYEVINSKDYGVPQNRERIFLVGFLDHKVYHRFQFAPKQKLTKRLKDVLEERVDEKYYLSETAIKGFQSHAERMVERGNGFKFNPTDGNNIASSITTKAGGRPDDNFVKVIGKLDIKGDDYIKRIYDDEGISPCLPTIQGGSQEPKISQKTQGETREYKSFCPTIMAKMGGTLPRVENNYRIRKLTPLECWRLQDFPDEAHEKAKYKKDILHFLFVYDKIQKSKKETQCNLLNVKLMDVKENQKPSNMGICVLCTTKENTKLEQLTKQNQQELIEKNQNVNFVIEKLEEREQKECVTSIIKWIDCTETLYTEMIKSGSRELVVTSETQKGKQPIESLWKIILDENLTETRLFITLIALRVIIELKIFTYVKIRANIEEFTINLKNYKSNLYKMELSSLKMENITLRVSDSMRYKQSGNSMTVAVVEMVFRQIDKALKGCVDNTSLFGGVQ